MADGTKTQYRARLSAARREVPAAVRDAEARQLRDHLPGLMAGLPAGVTVCAYMPAGAEPGSPAMVDRLRELGATVLLPVSLLADTGEHLPLRWGEYVPGTLLPGRYGLQEPPEPWLPSDAVARASVVLVPALAVDRRGVRLGRGGGFYDRSLRMCEAQTRLVAVVRDCEVLDALPDEPHDVRMTHALTPAGGLVPLGE